MTVLTQKQEALFLEQAAAYRAEPQIQAEMARRTKVSETYRALVKDRGIREGNVLSAEQLAQIVDLQREIQNLNPIVLPQLISTYTYYQHYKGFSGSRDEFAEHMAAQRSGWKVGHTGYPGADLQAWSRDMAALLSASETELGPVFRRMLDHPGAGRAFLTGLLILWDPTRFPLVNNAAVAVFRDKHGPLYIDRGQRASLRERASERYGLPQAAENTKALRTLGWMELCRELRQLCGFTNFFELDWMLWWLATKAKRMSKILLPTAVREGGGAYVGGPEELVTTVLSRVSPKRIETRERAALEARAHIEACVGRMTEQDLREMLRLFNVDFQGSKERADRFSPAFVGATANRLVESLPSVDEWLGKVWRAEGDAVYDIVTRAWHGKVFPSARSVLSMALHVKSPEHFAPVMAGLARGYRALTGKWPHRDGKQYKAYNEYLARMRAGHGLSPYVSDLFLWEANRIAKKKKASDSGPGVTGAKGGFPGFEAEAFRYFQELAANNNEDWYADHRGRFRSAVKKPMRHLIADLGERFVEPVCPELERKPTSPQTLATTRKHAVSATADPYWTYYWAAFHRRELKKTEDFQLYVLIDGVGVNFGFATGAARPTDKALLARRLRDMPDLARRAIEYALASGLEVFRDETTLDKADVTGPEELADLVEAVSLRIGRRHDRDVVVTRGSALVTDIDATFRAVYPLFALATADDPAKALADYWDDPDDDSDTAEDSAYTRSQLLHDTLISDDFLDELVDLLEDKGQIVLYGPPGTGKTWLAERIASFYVGAGGDTWTVQFHPSYGYEDFIEGIRPRIDKETQQPVYLVERGIFRRFCDEARRRPRQRFVLVVDEINRGNLPRIFGELLYLLERRGEQVELPVSGKPFSVPPNVFIVGTMNTADHSIALVDVALRRRFHFAPLNPDSSILRAYLEREVREMTAVADLLDRLNEELEKEGIDANLRIGHSHFMTPTLDERTLKRVWQYSIMPTLEEYFYGKPRKLERFAYERFVDADLFEQVEAVEDTTAASGDDDPDEDDGDAA